MNSKKIELFNYVYSSMYEEEKEEDLKWKEFEELCLFKNKCVPYDFIKQNEILLNCEGTELWVDLVANKNSTGRFITLNYLGQKEYINYKINELKAIIKNHGINIFKNLGNIFNNMCNESIKEILIEARNSNLINFDESIFKYFDDRLGIIIYDNIKVNLDSEKESNFNGNRIFINNGGNMVNQIGDGNIANIDSVNEYQLFKLLEEKIEAIKVEMKNKNCEEKIIELENALKNKDKKNALEVLSHLASIGSFIASGISLFL